MTNLHSKASPAVAAPQWLMFVPVSLFAMVMGLAGLGLAWRRAAEIMPALPVAIGEIVLALAGLSFIGLAVMYGAKGMKFAAACKKEFGHPVAINFFPTISIGLLLLGLGALPYSPLGAELLFAAGTILHLALTFIIFGRWLRSRHEINHVNPAWFIPVVGNIIIPLLGMKLGYDEISAFCFSIGIAFGVVLFTIVLYRVIFHDDLPPKLLPTLFILIPPPAIGMSSYLAVHPQAGLDGFATMLFSIALFLTMALLGQSRRFLSLPFAVSWWAFTFPLGAMALAALEYKSRNGGPLGDIAAPLFLALASLVVGLVLVRTVSALTAKTLFVPE